MSVSVRLGPWPEAEQAIRAVRRAVFTLEQGIDEALDFDGSDDACLHAVAWTAEGATVK